MMSCDSVTNELSPPTHTTPNPAFYTQPSLIHEYFYTERTHVRTIKEKERDLFSRP